MPDLAKQVTHKQVVAALEHIISNNLKLIDSKVHNLLYKGKMFPPKEVIRWAARLANIPNRENMTLSGGNNTNEPLRKMGFNIVPKKQNASSSNMDLSQLELLKEAYQRYKASEDYKNRQSQFKIVPVNKEILKATLAKVEVSNSDFTGFIQMFKYGCTDPIFDKYLEQNIPDKKECNRLSKLAYEANEWGYTGAGLNSITGLSQSVLDKVKDFLVTAFSITHTGDAVSLCKEFELQNVPQIKSGIFSPWLYYINPQVFPILNNSHNSFRKILNISQVYSEAILDFKFLKHEFGEEDLGMIDLFAHNINKYLQKNANIMVDPQSEHPKNQILYGPPGTGKTYHTIDKALEIIGVDTTELTRSEVKEAYNKKVSEGQIVFTTFHQSLSYEDFIEGIKPQAPLVEGGNISYEVEPGIFKSICETAKTPIELRTQNKNAFKDASFFKMSIGGKLRPDIHDYCLENNVVGLGYGNDEDFTDINKIKDWKSYRDTFKEKYPDLVSESKYHIQAMFIFQRMQIGDFVVITKGNHVIDAVGKIVSDYYFDNDSPNDYNQFRKVEWLAKNINQSPSVFFHKNISQQTIYEFYEADVKKEAFESFFEQEPTKQKNYVVIIDEINRGNVSSIFGELITCLEDSKRLGSSEELKVTLPYSKSTFGVPSNVYIIGTMNTADRSVEALDTALRRRFSFIEMLPDSNHALINDVEEIDLKKVLSKINLRLEKLVSRDHTIGHSFFMSLNTIEDLYHAFYNKIVPLLQEYFFGDYGKIGLVLGASFVEEVKRSDSNFFADFTYEDKDLLLEKKVYRINKFINDIDAFIKALKAI